MIAPTVHLNGTSGEALLDQIEAAHRAIQAAISAVEAAAPNARDYYLTPGSFEIARATHERHLRTLVSLRDDYMASYENIHEQIDMNGGR